ncbi:MAG: hypothetical protein O2822_08860 [Chloroflexi bacterium]|nr:hypothetical protein [Chloroflexota bacterium]
MAVAAMALEAGYWERWEQRSFGWKAAIEFLHPFGRDHAEAFAPLTPLFDDLRALPGVEVPAVEWLHATWLHLGFLRADDIMWSQVETYYASAAPRLRRIEPRPVRLGGIALNPDGRVTLGIQDGGLFREARRQAAIGAMKAREALQSDPAMTPDGDTFAATIDLAHLDRTASGGAVAQAIEPYRDLVLPEVTPAHLMLARLAALPEQHYATLDIVAQVPMLGDQHRGGYHN